MPYLVLMVNTWLFQGGTRTVDEAIALFYGYLNKASLLKYRLKNAVFQLFCYINNPITAIIRSSKFAILLYFSTFFNSVYIQGLYAECERFTIAWYLSARLSRASMPEESHILDS